MTESFMHFIKQTNAFENVHIPWHWYVVGKNHTLVCPAQVLNERWLVANRECVVNIGQGMGNQRIFDFLTSEQYVINQHPLVKSFTKGPMYTDVYNLQGAHKSKYNFALVFSWDKFLNPNDLRPICRWIDDVPMLDLTFKRFTWLFYAIKNEDKKLIATVAQVLNPNADSRCNDAKNNPDLLCVQIEDDADQCSNSVKTVSLGYLTYYQEGKKFWNFAIWSHGAENCQEAKSKVAFFTRLNAKKIRMGIKELISPHSICLRKPETKFYGFRLPNH